MITNNNRKNGFITLLAVLAVGAIAVTVAVSFLLLGVNTSQTSFNLEQSNQSKALANACAEQALEQIRLSTPYTGTGSLTLGQGTCTYTVSAGAGQNRTITASGTVGAAIRKVQVNVSAITPKIIVSWQEVS